MARPSFKPTPAQRRTVAIAAGGGMSHEELAIGLGISRNTLEKHFEAELSVGSISKRLEVLNAMHAAAKKGNVAAQRAYMSFVPKHAAPPAPIQEREAPKGKKVIAQENAAVAQVGTDWESLLPSASPVQ